MLNAVLIALSIAAPALVAFPRIVRDGMHVIIALPLAVLLSTTWSIGVVLILATTHASVIPGGLWVAVITAIVLLEGTRALDQSTVE